VTLLSLEAFVEEERMHRTAGVPQGLLLIAMAWLAPIGSTLFAPVLPKIIEHFAAIPNASILAPLALVTPALFVALLAPLAGVLADKLGRKRLALWAISIYAIAGVTPVWLDNLYAIIASRVVVGIAEAGVMTASTALICDYFAGERRAHWLSLQFGSASFVATICFGVAGFLGGFGWRTPFLVYAATALFIPLILVLIFEPKRAERSAAIVEAPTGYRPWNGRFAVCMGLTLLCGMLFYVTPVHISLVLTERGISDPGLLGLASAVGSLGVVCGAIFFRYQTRRSIGALLLVAMALQARGFVLLKSQASLPGNIAGMFINNIGCGISLPLVLAFTMSKLPENYRGRASGLWTSVFFIGQFICPLVVGAAAEGAGGMVPAMALFAGITLFAAAGFGIWLWLGRSLREPVTIDGSLPIAAH
jgi:MFS family permease